LIAKDDYYMAIAQTVALRSNCVGRSVGAVVVRGDRIVATGYNGTAGGLTNCLDGGCTRCANRSLFPSGTAYDLCICVHAEANAIASAARHGIALEGGTLYTTDQPCFSCAKELIQVGIAQVFYLAPWTPDERVAADYETLQTALNATRRSHPHTPSTENPQLSS
jgi:dCMP deaminase